MTIKYGEGLKKPGTLIEYTPEMVLELNECSEDIWYFLKYIKINHPDYGVIYFDPYDFQKTVLKNYQKSRFNVVLASRQSGKCVSYCSKIRLQNKNTNVYLDCKIGDLYNIHKSPVSVYTPYDKIIDEANVDKYNVLTPTGWQPFYGVCKTRQFQVYIITFDDSDIKCADTHIFMSNGKQIFAKDLKMGYYIDSVNGIKRVIHIEKTVLYENMYDLKDVNGGVYYTNGLLSHNTTTTGAYVLWYTLFNGGKNIGIVSNKQVSAIDILNRIKSMYKEIPDYMKPGIIDWNKTSILFENDTRIMVSATSEDAFRGRTLNLLVCDEFAFLPKHIAYDFWSANYPTISASKEAKIIIISTPSGMYNQFHTIYSEAERNFNSFTSFKSTWMDVPGRNEQWKKAQISNIGERRFTQEYDCEFLGSTNTVINTDRIRSLFTEIEEPAIIEREGKLRIYEKPVEGEKYVIGADTSKGTGEDYSVAQILKFISFTPLKFQQVAVFEDNHTDVYAFSDILDKLSIYYNKAYLMVENNAEGAAVVNKLWWDIETESLVNTGSKSINLGIRATRSTKPKAVLLMKKLIEDGCLEIHDKRTIEELASFIEENNRYFGKDLHDDLVSGLYWSVYISQMGIFEEEITMKGLFDKGNDHKNYEDEVWGIISDLNDNNEITDVFMVQ